MQLLGYKILRSMEPNFYNGIKVIRHVIEVGSSIGYGCEIEMDGKKYFEIVTWEFMTDEHMITKLQRKVMNEALGIR